MTRTGRRIEVRGTVQGVGFRPWIYRLARESGLAGRVSNHSRGVTIEAFGDASAIEAFLASLAADSPPAARIRELDWTPIPAEPASEFVIVESRETGERRVSIPAGPSDVRRLPVRGLRPARPALPLSLHQLHQLRPALHDRARRAVRPGRDDDGPVPDVRRLPARVRGPGRPALSRAAQRLPGLRAGSLRGRTGRPEPRLGRPHPAGGARPGSRTPRRRQGARRLPPGLRCRLGSRGPAPSRPQEAGGEALRRHGEGPRGRSSSRSPLPGGGAPADLDRAPHRPRASARRAAGSPSRSPRATRGSACCCRTPRSTTCCFRRRTARWS